MHSINHTTRLHSARPQNSVRRTHSSPALLQGIERLQTPINALHRGDCLLPIHYTDSFINLGTMNRHMTNIGIHVNHIDNILWSLEYSIRYQDPFYLQNDLIDARIEPNGWNGLTRASAFKYPENHTAPSA